MMEAYNVICLRDRKDMNVMMAHWFFNKWNIAAETYLESIQECQKNPYSIPQWYAIMENQKIVAGVGVIENDFHKRKDLTPNICAVYVESAYRKKGIARYMLSYVCNDLKKLGYTKVYLITDHDHFYEKCGFFFYDWIEEDSGNVTRMYCREL